MDTLASISGDNLQVVIRSRFAIQDSIVGTHKEQLAR